MSGAAIWKLHQELLTNLFLAPESRHVWEVSLLLLNCNRQKCLRNVTMVYSHSEDMHLLSGLKIFAVICVHIFLIIRKPKSVWLFPGLPYFSQDLPFLWKRDVLWYMRRSSISSREMGNSTVNFPSRRPEGRLMISTHIYSSADHSQAEPCVLRRPCCFRWR